MTSNLCPKCGRGYLRPKVGTPGIIGEHDVISQKIRDIKEYVCDLCGHKFIDNNIK